MKKKNLIFLTLFSVTHLCAITETIKKITNIFQPSGWIRHDAFWDSHQVVAIQEEMGIFYPEKKVPDECGDDINGNGQFSMLAIRTRMRTKIIGPKIFKAKSSGTITVDFFGKANLPLILRMRKAYLQLVWNRATLRLGQDWHPLYVPDAGANTISVAKGWPMQCHARQPMAQVFFHTKKYEVILAAISQLDGKSDGPDGPSTDYIRNAVAPNVHAQARAFYKDHFFGAGIDWKRIKPRLSAVSPTTGQTFEVHEKNDSFSAIAYAHLFWPDCHINSKFIYSENLFDLKQLSGYAVKSIDPITGKQEYTNTRAVSWWADAAITKWNTIEPGLFVGYTKNIGSRDCLAKDSNGDFIIFSRAPDIDYVVRVAPRARWKIKQITFGAELEYVRASYGTITDKGKVENGVPVNNFRFHFATFYYF